MNVAMSPATAATICEALGIDPGFVTKVIVTLEAEAPVTVVVERFVTEDVARIIGGELVQLTYQQVPEVS